MEEKQLQVYQSGSLREFVKAINDSHIKKEDIVTIFQDKHSLEYILLYYR